MIDPTILVDNIMQSALHILEGKKEFNELVLEQLVSKNETDVFDADRVRKLIVTNKRIDEAVRLIKEHDGCWR